MKPSQNILLQLFFGPTVAVLVFILLPSSQSFHLPTSSQSNDGGLTTLELSTDNVVYAAVGCGKDDPFCLKNAAEGGGVKPKGKETTLPVAIGKLVQGLLAFVGVLFFALIVYAGFRWMIAQGNDDEVNKAKGTIEHAAAGLVIIIISYTLVTFIGEKLFSNSSTPAPVTGCSAAGQVCSMSNPASCPSDCACMPDAPSAVTGTCQ